jgi:hypothetical protein
MRIRYRGNFLTEPLPSNDKGIFTEPLSSNDRGIHRHTHRLQRDIISLLYFFFQNKESRVKMDIEEISVANEKVIEMKYMLLKHELVMILAQLDTQYINHCFSVSGDLHF